MEVPGIFEGPKQRWVTSEYGISGATEERTAREAARGKQSGRTHEKSKIDWAIDSRRITDQEALGERTVWLDCDVIEADGGTRTASTLERLWLFALAMERLVAAGMLKRSPLIDTFAATSVGIVDDQELLLDLVYE